MSKKKEHILIKQRHQFIYGNEELIRSAITDMDNHQMTLDECMKLTRGRKNG